MLNLESFCRDHRIDYITEGHHHTHQGWAQIHCVFCSSGTDGWHLGFSLEGGNFSCWRCGSHSNWDVIGAIINTRNGAKIAEVLDKYDTGRRAQRAKAITRKKKIKTPPGTGPIGRAHRKYLETRNFDPDQLVEEWGIQGTKYLSGAWNWRIILPIHNKTGEVVSYTGRTIKHDTKPKYKMSDNVDMVEDPKGLLYGIDKIPGDSIIVVEGPADVWGIGFGAVALLGIDWTTEQANQIRKYKNRYIIFDPEELAQKRAWELAKWLSYFPGNTEIIDDLSCDPGDLDGEEKKEILSLLQ